MMKLFIFLLFLIVPYAFAADTRHADKLVPSEIKTVDKEAIEKLDTSKNVNGSLAQKPVINSKQLANKTDIITSAGTTQSTNQKSNEVHMQSMNSGALMRGIFVIFGLSVIVMAYMVFRSLRLKKNRPQMVRKYGILAHRQDVEMRPLPLDEDDDDDTTVFDASNIMKNES